MNHASISVPLRHNNADNITSKLPDICVIPRFSTKSILDV